MSKNPMPTNAMVARLGQQRKATYGLIPPVGFVLIATGVTAAMVAGNVSVFPMGAAGILPVDCAILTQRMAPGAGALGNANVDTISTGVGGSFRIHSSAATEVATWRYFVFAPGTL